MPEKVNPALIQLARKSRGVKQKDLASSLDVNAALLSRVENGLQPPSSALLEALARRLDYPVDFFYQDVDLYGPPVTAVNAMHRKRAAVSQREVDRAYAIFNLHLMSLRKLLNSVEVTPDTPLPSIHPAEYDGDIEHIARLVRSVWLMPPGPVGSLVDVVERAGVVVVLSDLDQVGIDGITYAPSDLPPCVFMNRRRDAARMRFSLAHELGHLVMHRVPTADMEREADQFASAFLMPAADLRPALHGRIDLARLAQLKPYWKVSMAALLYRAGDLGAVTGNQARYLWQQMSAHGYRTREPAELDFPCEVPTLLRSVVDTHLGDLGYTVDELASVLNLYGSQVAEMYEAEVPRLRVVG